MLVFVNRLFQSGMIRFIHQLFRFAVCLVHIRRRRSSVPRDRSTARRSLGSCSKDAASCEAFSRKAADLSQCALYSPLAQHALGVRIQQAQIQPRLGRSQIERRYQHQIRAQCALGLRR